MRDFGRTSVLVVLALSQVPPAFGTTQAQAEEESYSTQAWEAHERNDHREAIRLQELAVRQVDRNAPDMPALRARWRNALAGYYLEAGRCDDAERMALEAATLITSSRPRLDTITIRSSWNEELLWSRYREMGAHGCRRDYSGAIRVGIGAEANFGLVLSGYEIKAAILRHLALDYHRTNDQASALTAIDRAFAILDNADEGTRRSEIPRLRAARGLIQSGRTPSR
jgi:tetratricopeptide (TPR) repeat protein